ncbi:MAG: PAS domain-containing protein [Acidobacteria bacterium]|nr:PAS domain-containing protein [Acidobacteriota bacterium]
MRLERRLWPTKHQEIQIANPAAYSVLGFAAGELVGVSVVDLLSLFDPERARQSLARVVSGDASRTIRDVGFATAEREEVWVDLTLSPINVEGRRGVQIVIVDQTMRHIAEAAVRLSQHRFRMAFLGSATAAVLVNLDGSIAEANTAFIDMVDSDAGEYPKRPLGRRYR